MNKKPATRHAVMVALEISILGLLVSSASLETASKPKKEKHAIDVPAITAPNWKFSLKKERNVNPCPIPLLMP